LGRNRFTAKDFRTWGASAAVTEAMATGECELTAAIDVAAERLGNTRAVCRSSYVHPIIEEAASTDGWRRRGGNPVTAAGSIAPSRRSVVSSQPTAEAARFRPGGSSN